MTSSPTVRPSSVPAKGRPSAGGARAAALAADALLIVLFAALGRRTHESGLDPAGILGTALPFLIAWAGASLATLRNWARVWPAGVVVWLATVAGGLLLRVLLGDTAAFSFQLVTAAVLGVFLLGRRSVTALLTRPGRRARS